LEIDWIVKLIALFCLLVLSAFFSGSEVALFSLKIKNIKGDFVKTPLLINYINTLLNKPRRLLVTVLLGNTVVNVAASIISVTLALEFAAINNTPIEVALLLQIILLTVLILLLGELIPKVFASKNPVKFTKVVVIPIYWISVILYPIAEIITEFIQAASNKIILDRTKDVMTEDELTKLTELGQEKGAIEKEEQEIITSIMEFRSVLVSEIMTPRVDIVAVSKNATIKAIINTITESGHSRLPLYNDDLDEILGIIYAKDLLPYLKDKGKREVISVKDLARKPMYAPETKRIKDMLHEFQEKKMHVAIVVDEYGGTSGLVTLEDVIEEVVGEIWDEFDREEESINKIAKDKFIVLGKTSINDINETIGFQLLPETDDYDTIGGLVLSNAARIPEEGYSFKIADYCITVKKVVNKRIDKVLVEKV
jgi:gliding motility-associated protein GldE